MMARFGGTAVDAAGPYALCCMKDTSAFGSLELYLMYFKAGASLHSNPLIELGRVAD